MQRSTRPRRTAHIYVIEHFNPGADSIDTRTVAIGYTRSQRKASATCRNKARGIQRKFGGSVWKYANGYTIGDQHFGFIKVQLCRTGQ
jgi:hypothetical protein